MLSPHNLNSIEQVQYLNVASTWIPGNFNSIPSGLS